MVKKEDPDKKLTTSNSAIKKVLVKRDVGYGNCAAGRNEPFDFNKPQNWDTYKSRFSRYCIVAGVKESEHQVNSLLYAMGPRAETIFTSFGLSAAEAKDIAKVRERFDGFFNGRKNIIYERAKFNMKVQSPRESMEDFITDLCKLADSCEYENFREQLIRDRIVVGVADCRLSERLQLIDGLDYKKAVEVARSYEAVQKQNQLLRSEVAGAGTVVNRVQKKSNVRKEKTYSTPWKCFGCGSDKKHAKKACPARNTKCNKCIKVGHWAKVCKSGKSEAKSEGAKHKTAVRHVEDDSRADSFFVATVNQSQIKTDEPWRADATVKSVTVSFQLDPDANVTIIIDRVYFGNKKTFGNLQPADRKLESASRDLLKCIGMFTATLRYGGQAQNANVFVVKGLRQNLLGRVECVGLNLVMRCSQVSVQNESNQLVEELTDWCSGIVLVKKQVANDIRLCVDLTKLNQAVEREYHPMPVVEHTLGQLKGAKYITKLDCVSGFWQVLLSENSKKLTTFITPYGRFCFRRLPFGISSAPEFFQKRVSQILEGLPGVANHTDDILVWGEDIQEHDSRLRAVLRRLNENNITLNASKCQFCVQETMFLGHRISADGINPDPSKVAELTAPKDVSSVRSFLGMVNYLGKFVPRLSETLAPIYNLLKSKNDFIWSDCEKAFKSVLKVLTSSPCLPIFDPNRRTVASADASSYGIGAVLRQEDETGVLRPIAYASRTLTDTERWYAQIEKEILALIWACERLHDFVYGNFFYLKTDHRPLVPLLMTKNLDELSPRLQRMRMRLMHYDFECFFTAGKDILAADYLSRSSLKTSCTLNLGEEISAHVQFVLEQSPVSDSTLSRLLEMQAKDHVYCELAKYIQDGWPCKGKVSAPVRPFFNYRANLSLICGFIMFGDWFYIPPELRREALEAIHSAHQDFYSHYPEVYQLPNLRSLTIILGLKDIFAHHGIPEVIRSDNGTQFDPLRTTEFQAFRKYYGFAYETSSPHFPQSNGFIEAMVKTVKSGLEKSKDFSVWLLEYRATPLKCGFSPSELAMGRRIKSLLPITPSLLVPKIVDRERLLSRERERIRRQKEDFDKRHHKIERDDLEIGDCVWIRDLRRWGIVKKHANQPRSFIVQSDSGEYRRNRSHLHRLDASLGYFHILKDAPEEQEWGTPSQSPEKLKSPSPVVKQKKVVSPISNEEVDGTKEEKDATNPVHQTPGKVYPTRDRKKVSRWGYETLGGSKSSTKK
ncbi:uncharacterized protein [Polyergus mexicanus]|uniref:uncharacterized protein n=1 Tax=Polyergus mexicanus TaxID=615972 RepID=UPI0038B4D839